MTESKDAERPLTVLVAMSANLLIAAAKFVVAALSGSSALLAEGVHSVVDTLNQAVLLVGAKRSHRVPDFRHPFGYGKEIYFWSLIYSVLLLGVGGGVSIYKGVSGLLTPSPVTAHLYGYVVLVVAFVAEGISLLVATRAISREKQDASLWSKLEKAGNPSSFVVFAEDAAALVGLLIAFVGLLLTQLLETPIFDASASILIGFVLCATAVALISKTKGLVIGRAVEPEIVEAVQRLVEERRDVRIAAPPLTMQLGPEQVMVALDICFRAEMGAEDVARAVDQLEARIREAFPQLTRIYIEPQLGKRDIEREQPPPALDESTLPVQKGEA